MKHTKNITADSSTLLCSVTKPIGLDRYFATVSVFGTFGSGTVTLQYSPDGGSTKIDVTQNGTAVTFTANGGRNVELGFSNKLGEEILLYATMAGSTTPDVDVIVHDNAA